MKNIVRVVPVGVAVLVGAQSASAQTGVSLSVVRRQAWRPGQLPVPKRISKSPESDG